MAFKNYKPKQEEVISPYLTYKQAQQIRNKRRHKELLNDVSRAGRTDSEKERERILLSNPTSRVSYVFTNPKTKASQTFHGIEYSEYTAYPGQPIIHGVVTISEFDDKGIKTGEKSEDIYVYQPRFEGRNNFVVGPRYNSDGSLNNRAAYAFKDPGTGVIYIGSIPKREIVSNRQFDFDSTNQDNFNKSCEHLDVRHRRVNEVISIKYDTDPKTGCIKSVNMDNPQEKAKLNAYLNTYSTGAIADDKIDGYIHRIEKELKKFEKISDKVEESVARVGLAQNYQEELAQENTQQDTKTTQSLQEENAKIINDALKYGRRPTFASPINDGIGGLEISRHTPPPPPPGGPRRC